MIKIKEYKMEWGMIVFSGVAYIVGVLLGQDSLTFGLGILFGLIVSLLKLKSMERTFSKALEMTYKKAENYARVHYMIRYLLTGAALAVAATSPKMSLLGAFLGVMSMKPAAYGAIFFQKRKNNRT